MNRTKVLLCKLQGNRLNVEAFEHDGKITINRMRIEWEQGKSDVGLGKDYIFDSENALFDYMKTDLVPWLANKVFPNIESALSAANIDVRIFPITMQGEIVRNVDS